MRNPSPWMEMSVEIPVNWVAPGVKLIRILCNRVPNPSATGLVPPNEDVALSPVPFARNWLNWVANRTELDLKAVVLVFATLFPMTSSQSLFARNPEIALNIARLLMRHRLDP